MKKILITEDCQCLRELLVELLMDEGYHIECAENGQAALELLKVNAFDILITDYNMPVMDGKELVKNLISLNIKLDKILVISGVLSNQMEFGALMASHDNISYSSKPLVVGKFLELIKA